MAVQVKTDISLEEYEFTDTAGKRLFSITFNPADVGIAKRYEQVVDFFNKLDASELESDDMIESLEKVNAALSEKLDMLCNAPVSSSIFSVMAPLTPLSNGKFYVEEILERIGELIESTINVRMKKVQSRLEKYTAKYPK